ncbi:MAG: methyltransferase domain-containing protein [Chitinophagaceae bacterium]|nr:MAG: methyltransferase domain-containing protein [Chitinophagaceae bacterium]
MPDFSKRSYQKELLDQQDVPFRDVLRNMEELNTVNNLLGGHSITCNGVHEIMKTKKLPVDHEWLICEIGCGNGNNLAVIYDWCRSRNIKARFIGIDINSNCIASTNPTRTGGKATYITSDYRSVNFIQTPDIIFSSLFCHHFTDLEMTDQLTWLRKNSRVGFFINDLHRHPLAYYSIRFLTKIFSRSYLVKNDAPLSVLRGFTKSDWLRIMRSAGIDNFSIKWKWAFRWLIVIVN